MSENMKIKNFGPMKLTQHGLNLLSKAQTGTPLVITKAVVGSGYLEIGQSAEKLTNLVKPVSSHTSEESGTSTLVDITYNKVIAGGKTALQIKVQNGDTEFYIREIGIMAQDPDEGEILYAYTSCSGDTHGMPIYDGQNRVEDYFTLITDAENASDIVVNVTLPAEVRQEEFDAHTDNRSIHWQISIGSEEPKGNNYIWFAPYTPQESTQEVVLQSVDYNGDETRIHVDVDGELNTADNTAVSDEDGTKVILFE